MRLGTRSPSQPELELTPDESFLDGQILDDLFVLLALVDSSGLQVLKRGGISKSEIQRLSAQLNIAPASDSSLPPVKQDRAIRFLLKLVFDLGLLVNGEDGSSAKVSPLAENWLSQALKTQSDELARAWLRSSWDELFQTPNLRIDLSGRRHAPREARTSVIQEIALLDPDKWHSLQDLTDIIKRKHPNFLRHASDPYNFSITVLSSGKGKRFRSEDSEDSFWYNLEGSLIRNYIYDPLYWLGCVRLGRSESGRITRFAIVRDLREILSPTKGGKKAKPKRKFVLEPTFEITADREFDRGAMLTMERFANRIQTDVVFKYRITKHSIARGLERGIDSHQMLAFLKRHSESGMPQNVEYSIKEWSARYGNIRLRDAIILQTTDEFLLSELLASKKVSQSIECRAGEKTALIDPEQLNKLFKTLKKEGYLPELDDTLKRSEPEQRSFSLTPSQCVAVFASAMAVSRLFESLGVKRSSHKKFAIDEELLLKSIPYKQMLHIGFISAELCDAIMQPERLLETTPKGKKATPVKAQKVIRDSLASATALKSPIVVEYLSPVFETIRCRKMTITELVETADGGYAKGKDHQDDTTRVIPISSIKSVSPLK